jgi:malate dehydrogenase (oxaloacetate-decarboxylating)(NADP+)
VATGGPHSELPFVNIVNNGLAFPNLVRGLLDARAIRFVMEIGIALARALAMRARDPVPEVAKMAENKDPVFGRDWILPSYFDPELKFLIPPAVFGAAVARGARPLTNYDPTDYARWLRRFWEERQAA